MQMNILEKLAETGEFNINKTVWAKVTKVGHELHKQDHARLLGSVTEYTPIKEDADGWSEWQLWCLMQAFGAHLHIGMSNPIETTIMFLKPDTALATKERE